MTERNLYNKDLAEYDAEWVGRAEMLKRKHVLTRISAYEQTNMSLNPNE